MIQTSTTQRSDEAGDKKVIRPFRANFSDMELAELRRRINATKWPERETVTDPSQGVQLATIQALARYWATEYDWRKIEATMNALPQFMFGITAALYGEITLKDGRVEQSNFHNYQMLRINEAPAVEVYIVQNTEAPGGMGEAGTSLIVPAVTNAIFAATGKRLRKLPVDTAALKTAV